MLKHTAYRNRKILDAAKGQPCMRCGKEDGTTVAAHSNYQEDGKGMGKKADDLFVAFLCADCHRWMDEGRATYDAKREDFHRAMKKTLRLLLDMGVLK